MTAPQTVTIRENSHRIPPGSVGTLLSKGRTSGLWIVDIPGRGRLAFTPLELGFREKTPEHENGSAMQTIPTTKPEPAPTPEPARRQERCPDPGTLRVGEVTLTLYMAQTELADALGLSVAQLRAIAKYELGMESQGVGATIHYTAGQIRRIWRVVEAMREFEVGVKQAVRIVAKLDAKGGEE